MKNEMLMKNIVALIIGLCVLAIGSAASAIIKVNVLEERTNNFSVNFSKIDATLIILGGKIDEINKKQADARYRLKCDTN